MVNHNNVNPEQEYGLNKSNTNNNTMVAKPINKNMKKSRSGAVVEIIANNGRNITHRSLGETRDNFMISAVLPHYGNQRNYR